MKPLAFALVLAASSTAFAEREMEGAQVKQGFALELHLGSQFLNLGTGGTTISVGAVQGGFLAGYKISRFLFGLGFEISRIASGSAVGGTTTSQADTAILFVPGLRVAFYRTPDARVELFGQFDIGFGTAIEEGRPNNNESNFRLFYDLGPGVRYWVHPHFAVSGVTGVAGNFTWVDTTVGTTTTTRSTGVTAIFAALQILGVF